MRVSVMKVLCLCLFMADFDLWWVQASDPERDRIGTGRSSVPRKEKWPRDLLPQLHNLAPPDVREVCKDDPRKWQSHYQGLHGHIVGLVLVSPLFSPSVDTYLSAEKRAQARFYHHTRWAEGPLVFRGAQESTITECFHSSCHASNAPEPA